MGTDSKSGLELRSLIKKSGELEISLVNVPIPEPKEDEIVVRVDHPVQELKGDVFGHVQRPSLCGVECDNPESIRVLTAEKVADDALAIGFGRGVSTNAKPVS